MCGMLTVIPMSPLRKRLAEEGRLDPGDVSHHGTSVIPKRMSREEFKQGYQKVMRAINDPAKFLDRSDSLYLDPASQLN